MAKKKAIKVNKLLKVALTPRVFMLLVAIILVVAMMLAAPNSTLNKKDLHKTIKPKSNSQTILKPKTVVTPVATPAPAPVTTKTAASNPPSTIKSSAPVTPVAATAPTPGKSVSGLTPSSSGSSTTGSSTSGNSNTGSSTSGSPANIAYASLNWAGYMANTGAFTAVSGNWLATSPTGNGSTTSADATWIGIGGVNTSDLIQTGTDNIVSSSGNVTSSAFYELLPSAAETIPSMAIDPGDHMSASVTELSAGIWDISLRDNTSGQSFTTTVSYSSSNSSAEWIQEDPSYGNGRLVPFDNFGTAYFTNGLTTINGTSEGTTLSGASGIKMVNGSGQTVALPSSLNGGNFNVTYQ